MDGEGPARRFDYVLVGGGLQNGLIALALLARAPRASIALVEREAELGGNHTWCFHADDLPPAIAAAVEPLVTHRWSGYDVIFPGYRRRLAAPYAAATSARFREVVGARLREAPGCELVLGAHAHVVGQRAVEVERGGQRRELAGRLVVDARGPAERPRVDRAGFQVFFGLELALAHPHGLSHPVLMDATIAQIGGFRFFYTLPLGPNRVLLEDTCFADEPILDRESLRERILARAGALDFAVERVEREEAGILPMPWAGDLPEAPDAGAPLRGGYRGGWFHPATGYSFPVAARLAAHIAARSPERASREIGALVRRHRRQARYGHLLNRLAFDFFAPERRVHAFERFYRLPEATIRRFYALELTTRDKVRILAGRPPRGMSIHPRFAREAARS